jgi:eukaryotic-like serine/threonine-protein kinase
MKHSRDEPPPLSSIRPDLPPSLCAIVHKMMAKDPAHRYQTGRELLRDLVLLRENLTGQTTMVSLEGLSVHLAPPPASSPALTQSREAATTTAVPHPRRIMLYALMGLSLAAALAVGAVAGWLRRPTADAPPPSAAPNADAVEADDALLPVNDEEALRKMVDKYLHSADAGRNVSVGLGLCLDLGLLYLEQHRLDDAEKLFDRLSGIHDVRQYQTLGRLGGAMVLAFRDRAPESNQAFRDIVAGDPLLLETFKRTKDGKPIDPDFRKVWHNPRFRFWLAQAINDNVRNGIPEKEIPPAVQKWREPRS